MTIPAPVDRDELHRWIIVYLATVIGEPSENIDPTDAISEYDLDSIDAVTAALDLEAAFGVHVHPETFLLDDASIDDIVARIVGV